MARLTGETVASTYSLLLKVQTTGIHATTQRLIEDGDANPSALLMSESGITSDGTLTVNGISTLTGAVTAPAGVTGALDGIVGGTTPAAVTGTTIDGVIGSVTPAAITGTTITGTTIGGTVITASTNFAGDITGDVTGNADTATKAYVTANESTDEENLISFVADEAVASGNHGLEMDSDLTYNPSTGTLTTTAVVSDLTGDIKTTNASAVVSTVLNANVGSDDAATFTGVLADGVTATTQAAGTNDTTVATTAYVDAAGTVLQVVYADLDDIDFSSTSTTMEQITGLTASITPASEENYILIQVMISYGMQYENASAFGIYSDLTSGQIGSSDEAASGARNAIVSSANNPYQGGVNQAQLFSANLQYRDAPTTWTEGAIAYTVTVSNNNVGSIGGPGFTLNKPYGAVASTVSVYGLSSITLTEIKG